MKYLMSFLLAGVFLAPMGAKAADVASQPPTAQQYPAPAPAPFAPPDASGIYLRGDLGASWLNWPSANTPLAYVGDAGIGLQLNNNIRADITYGWSGNFGVPPGTLSTSLILGNVYYDFANSTAFTPYIGAGVGYGWEWSNSASAISTNGVAVGATAGVAYNITNNLAVDVGYRFHDILAANQQTPEHQVAAGLRVKF